jgi:C1A family cysteine protease
MMNQMMNRDYTKYPVTYIKRGHQPDDVFYTPKTTITLDITNVVTTTSLRNKIPYIFDQGKMNSCVSNATALAISYLNNDFIPSRLFIYYNARLIRNYGIETDIGVAVVDGCASVQQFPPCQETLWPYVAKNHPIKPPENAYSNPIILNDFTYFAVKQNLNDIKHCINDGNPIIFGIVLYQSFYDYTTTKTGVVKMPKTTTEVQKGGHCILMVGYDDTTQCVTCANSWGTYWGNRGFFTLPYQYLLDPDLSFDFYILKFTNTNININTNKKTICCTIT